MSLGIEKRLHPRIPVSWPVLMVTVNGSIEGEVRNISLGGAFIQLSKEGDFSGDLQIHLQPSEQRSISVTGRKAWSGNFNFDGKEVLSGVGRGPRVHHFPNISLSKPTSWLTTD
jgi:hypothetical protein